METAISGSTRARLRCLAGAIYFTSRAYAGGLTRRSVRARRRGGRRLLSLADRSHLSVGSRAGLCGAVASIVQGVPTSAETRELQPRPIYAGNLQTDKWRQLTMNFCYYLTELDERYYRTSSKRQVGGTILKFGGDYGEKEIPDGTYYAKDFRCGAARWSHSVGCVTG